MVSGDIDAAREDDRANWPRLCREADGSTDETTLEPVAGRWRSFYENVAAAIRGQEELAVTAESARAVIGVLDAARESARTGQAVEMAAR